VSTKAQHASEIALAIDRVRTADPNEINEPDLTSSTGSRTMSLGWLYGLLVVASGAVAVTSAARYLMASGR
jgi:hypothetical protein